MNVIWRKCGKKVLGRSTQHIVVFDSILSPIGQVALALRMVLAEASQCAQFSGRNLVEFLTSIGWTQLRR